MLFIKDPILERVQKDLPDVTVNRFIFKTTTSIRDSLMTCLEQA